MKRYPLILLSLIGVAFLLLQAVQIKDQLVVRGPSGGAVQDFAYYYLLATALSDGTIRDPYSVVAQQGVMSATLGVPVDQVLALGPSPTLFLFLRPLLSLSLPHAYLVWLIVGLAVLLLGFGVTLRSVRRSTLPVPLSVAVGGAFFAPVMMTAALLGQTSLVALGSLLMLGAVSLPAVAVGALGFLLSVKPPYLVLGVIAVATRGTKQIFVLLLGATVAAAISLALLGVDVWFSYLSQLTTMAQELPRHYSTSIDLSVIGTFRGVAAQLAGRDVGGPISSVIFGVLSIVSLAIALTGRRSLAIILGFGAYLLFTPYAGRYEDLLILTPLLLVLLPLNFSDRRTLRYALLATLCALCSLVELSPLATFATKLLALSSLWLAVREGQREEGLCGSCNLGGEVSSS